MKTTTETATLQRVIGAVLVMFGALVIVRWVYSFERLIAALPGSAQMGIITPTLFVATGLCCLLLPHPASGWRNHLVTACIAVTIVLPTMTLLQQFSGIDLGIDFVRVPTPPTPANPHPGRMAPNTATAFLLAGIALLLLQRYRPWHRWLSVVLISLVVALGLGGLASHVLRLETLYRGFDVNTMLPATGVALSGLSLALWLMHDRLGQARRSADTQLARITARAVVVLLLVAVAAGVAGFGLLRETHERAVLDSMWLTAKTNAAAISHVITQSLWLPRTIVSRAELPGLLDAIDKAPDARAPRESLQALATSLLTGELQAVEVRSPTGALLAMAGKLAGDESLLRERLTVDGFRASLLWNDGYIVETRSEVVDGGRHVGSVRIHQRLAIVDRLLADIRDASATHDALLCSRQDDEAVCAPTFFYPERFRIPMFDAAGKPNLPINRALVGEHGVLVAKDLRGTQVAAAYSPVAAGLGLVVKADVDTLYAPVKEQVAALALTLLTLVAAGAYVLFLRVRPLISGIDTERERIRVILDNSNDAFIAIDSSGAVTDWNQQAEATFGWTAGEAIGQPLAQLIVPVEQRQAHADGMRRFESTGTGPMIDRRLELTAVDRNGREFPIELSIAAYNPGNGYVSTAFVRDISDRRRAERQLAEQGQRLRSVSNTIPASVGYFDLEERCRFANDIALEAQGIEKGREIGITLREALGDDGYRQHAEYVRKALLGERSEFEGSRLCDGDVRHYQAHLVPQLDLAGAVCGFYVMSFDITALRHAQLRQAQSERRLRAIADNLPVMISYIDPDECVTFLNKTSTDWIGIDHGDAVGSRLIDVIGENSYRQSRAPLARALGGERVAFELLSTTTGRHRHLRAEFIPDIQADGAVAGAFTLITDVTVMKEVELRLLEAARIDTLTGLDNRRAFDEKLLESLKRAARSTKSRGLLFLDIDRFKAINDSYGHPAGDAVLREFALRLRDSVRVTDIVARFAGDEFVVLLEGLHGREEPEAVARKIIARIGSPFMLADGRAVTVSTSIGIAWHGAGPMTAAQFLSSADTALYQAKAAGRNTYVLAAA